MQKLNSFPASNGKSAKFLERGNAKGSIYYIYFIQAI